MPSPTSQTNTVADLLAHGETDRLECKSAKGGFPKSFWESYSAFANMDGGTIVLGVSEPKKGIRVVEGVKRPDVLAKTLWDTVNNPDKVSANVLFPRHVRVEDAGGKKVLVVEKAFRRISISNPGTFRIPKSVAISGGTSDARNANLFNIFSLVDIGERSGSGLCNLFDVWSRNGFPPPEVEESFEPDRIRLSVSTGPTTEKTTEKNGPTTEKTTEKNGSTTEKILSLLAGAPLMTTLEIAKQTGLTEDGVAWNLRKLKASGRLRRVGPDKGGHWEVLSPPSPPAKP